MIDMGPIPGKEGEKVACQKLLGLRQRHIIAQFITLQAGYAPLTKPDELKSMKIPVILSPLKYA
jgi:hypothetical protein